jgi:hypothetical protein
MALTADIVPLLVLRSIRKILEHGCAMGKAGQSFTVLATKRSNIHTQNGTCSLLRRDRKNTTPHALSSYDLGHVVLTKVRETIA